MKLDRLLFKILPLATAATFSMAQANAGLVGSTVRIDWTYQAFQGSKTAIVGSDVEVPDWIGTRWNFGDDSIDITLMEYNGLSRGVTWRFTSPAIADFSAFKVSADAIGWSDSMVTLVDDVLTISYTADVTFVGFGGTIRVELETPQNDVPEPSSLALLAAGVGLIARQTSSRGRRTA